MAGLSDPKQGHLSEHRSRNDLSNGSGCVPVLLDLDGKTALLHQQERVGDVPLFNQNLIELRAQQFRFKLIQMGSQQIPQPAVDWSLLPHCRIHAGQVMALILISLSLIP